MKLSNASLVIAILGTTVLAIGWMVWSNLPAGRGLNGAVKQPAAAPSDPLSGVSEALTTGHNSLGQPIVQFKDSRGQTITQLATEEGIKEIRDGQIQEVRACEEKYRRFNDMPVGKLTAAQIAAIRYCQSRGLYRKAAQ
jgi:hypothetical protein